LHGGVRDLAELVEEGGAGAGVVVDVAIDRGIDEELHGRLL
jgi:hypothetical protein